MTSIDTSTLLNWLVPGLIGLILGTFSSWLTNRYQKRRDDIAWAREQEKLKKSFEHEKSMLELQFQQKLKELEQQLSQQNSTRLREDILRGVDDAHRVIKEIRTFEGLPIYPSIRAGGFGLIAPPPPTPEDAKHAVILDNIIHILYPLKKATYNEFQTLLNDCTDLHWIQVGGDALNRAQPIPIENGDFALIGKRKEINDDDIVIASILNEFDVSHAVMRRYRKSKNLLSSETNKSSEMYPPLHIDQNTTVIAVVLGVAKEENAG